VKSGDRTWNIAASWPESVRFDELVQVAPLDQRQLREVEQRDGVGAPLVARWEQTAERKKTEPFLSDAGYLAPVTVTLDFRASGQGRSSVMLRVHEVRTEETVSIAGRKHALAADFSAVSELVLTLSQQKKVGMPGMDALRHSDKYLDKMGILALEPPSPDRIPVIFVHGLMSRPLTWHNAFNELGSDPVIRKNYQIYFFRYPSGVPVVYSAAKFRQQLSVLHEELERVGNHRAAHHMVLIGHSMGGLVSKMQITSSGDRLWLNVLGAKPSDLGLSPEELKSFQQFLEFNPNPNVDRVIFVSTPHRGSKLAEGFVGAVARRLISLPGKVLATTLGTTVHLLQGQASSNGQVAVLLKRGIPNSVENLSPKSRFVKESMLLPLKPGLHVHTIAGNKDGRPLTDPKCGDGVVPYTSAHLDGVDSELVVRSNHGAHEKPEAIAEMRRILLLHLKGMPSR
jgi:triacylglycerol esterase/lipase EstA (alpha/beta hydrolase family)